MHGVILHFVARPMPSPENKVLAQEIRFPMNPAIGGTVAVFGTLPLHRLFVTDATINIAPDLTTKVDIVQNSVDMLCALGNPQPKAAVLSAAETVNPKIPGTLDAVLLCKMAERSQTRAHRSTSRWPSVT